MMLVKMIIAMLIAVIAVAARPVAAATVYVIRHLPKAQGDDPPLTSAGAIQARQLADILADARITAVFATATRRAQETAGPLATRLGVPVTPYDPRNVDALAQAVARANGSVLIVGHSNTVPDLVARFGGDRPAPVSEADYGILYVVHAASSQAHQIKLN